MYIAHVAVLPCTPLKLLKQSIIGNMGFKETNAILLGTKYSSSSIFKSEANAILPVLSQHGGAKPSRGILKSCTKD